MKKILFMFLMFVIYASNVFSAQITYTLEGEDADNKRTILEGIQTNTTELYSLITALDSAKLESTDIDLLAELNAILTDATLISQEDIGDSTNIGLDTGSTYLNFGDSGDDSLNELFSAIDTKIGTLGGGHDPVTIGTANGLSLSTQVLSLALATSSSNGAMSSAWVTFLLSIDTEAEFKALYNLEAGTDFYSITSVNTLLANKLNIIDIDDIPVDGVVNAPISSNWAYDHENAADPHSVYATDTDISNLQTDDLVTLSGVDIGSTNLGTFTGSTIQDDRTNKEAFQDLETEVEKKLDSFTTLSQLNTIVADATLLDDGAISDSNQIGLYNGTAFTNFGALSDDSLNEMFVAVDEAIGALPGGHDAVTIGTANGLSLLNQVLSLSLATNSANGAMSSSWITFLESINTEAEFKTLYNLEEGTDFYSTSATDTLLSGKLDSFTTLAELNAYLSDAVLLDDGVISDSTAIGLTTGDNYTNYGSATDDSLNEMFSAIDTAFGNIHSPVTLGTANGLSLSTQELSLGLATNSVNGAMSSSWITFLESIDTELEFKTLYNLEAGVDYQAYSTILSIYGGINPSSNVQSILGADDYASVRTLLGVYSSSQVDTILGDYVTGTSLTTTLSDYITSTSLTTTLSDYATLTGTPEFTEGAEFGGSTIAGFIFGTPVDRTPGTGEYGIYLESDGIKVSENGVERDIGSGSAADITVADMADSAVETSAEGLTDTDTAFPTSAAVKAYADAIIAGAPTDTASDPDIADATGWYTQTTTNHLHYVVYGVSARDFTDGALDDSDTTDPVGVADADSTHTGAEDSVTSGIDWTEPYLDVSTVTCTVVNATPTSPEVTCIGNACDTEALTPDGTDTVTCTWSADDLAGNSASGTDLVQEFTYSGGATYLVSLDFEETGTPPGVTPSGSYYTFDYTTTALSGLESCRLGNDSGVGDGYMYASCASSGTVYGYIEYYFDGTYSTDDYFYILRDSSDTALFQLYYNASGVLATKIGSAYQSASYTLSADTLYYIWFTFTPGNGDAASDIYVSTTQTKPGTATQSRTGGTADGTVDEMVIHGDSHASGFLIIDDVHLSESDITGAL